MIKKTLILTVEVTSSEWQTKALSMQIKDWLNANKTIMPIENLIILPANGPTRLYWLEGEQNAEDIKTLEQIKDRIKPVLECAIDIKIDKEKKFVHPKKRTYEYTRISTKHKEIFKKN